MESHALDTGTSLKTAEPSPTQRSRTSGFSRTRLARMHDTLLRHVESGRLPGLVALISRRGAEHVDAIGYLGVRPHSADAARYDFPLGLGDEADHGGGRDDSRRGMQAQAGRSRR